MIIYYSLRSAKLLRDGFNRKVAVMEQQLQEFNLHVVESARFGAKAIKFQFKICHLSLKVRNLHHQVRFLAFEHGNLVRKQTELLLLKINYIFFDSGISECLRDAACDLLPVHAGSVNQNPNSSDNPIIRQVCNKIVYVDSCQTVTLTKRLSIKSSALPSPSQLRAMIFWTRPILSANYAKLKNVSSLAKPLRQQTVEKTRKVSFPFLRPFDVLFCERHSVGRLALRLSASALAFASVLRLFHLKKYVEILVDQIESIRMFSSSQENIMANKRLSKGKQALVLSALCEGTPIRACARMFQSSKNAIKRVIRETGEAFTDYMGKNFRDLPCIRIEMDEQWQYVGAHGSRLIKPEAERGDFWLWCCIDADTKLVFSHRVGKRDWWTGNQFVEDVRNRVKLPVQIATDSHRPYAFHIRQHFGYEGYSYGTETKIFGEPKLTDGTLARLGRNEGVRRMETAERKAVVGSPDLESLTTSHVKRAFLTVRQELKRFERKGLGYSKSLEMHKLAVALHFGVYNFVRKHHTLGTTPAVAAGLEEKPWSLEQVVEMTEAYWRRKRC